MNTYLVKVLYDSDRNGTTQDRFLWCGYNTGNLVWMNAIKNQLCYNQEIYPQEIVLKGTASYVLPAANFLNVYDNFLEVLKGFFTINQYKITIIGLGAQLTEELNTPSKLVSSLPKERINALREFAEHSTSIGIRGEITAECLDRIGIHNYRIIGCPSFYQKNQLSTIKIASPQKVCFSLGFYGNTNITHLLELMLKRPHDRDCYMMQAQEDLPRTLLDNIKIENRHMAEKFPDAAFSASVFENYIKTKGKIFFTYDEWFQYLANSQFTFSAGCRFHGNMLCFLAGIPALWIINDSRMRELVKVMRLPHIDLKQVNKVSSVEELTEFCKYDDLFYENYEKMYENYLEFLNENDVMHCLN